jgi:copper chaperone CopZ
VEKTMKKGRMFQLLGLVGAALALGLVVYHLQAGAQAGEEPAGPSERVLFQVDGLTCGSCEGRVRQALQAKTGVRAVGVDLGAKTVAVEYEAGAADPKELADTMTRLGYPARYLASGAAVPVAPAAPAKRAGGCAGGCCPG